MVTPSKKAGTPAPSFGSVSKQTMHLLQELKASLQARSLWDTQRPPLEKLQSTTPFASDTLAFYQWLQFIMIPTLQQRIEQRQPLPNSIAVHPMAIEVWRGQLREHKEIILLLKALDNLLDGHNDRH
ncbi:YqcC family protein [Aliidiomarina halalkaliphila]|uniref:YqcC family protein n=1 Tax=Aliidiomarina halalkaliphila TaxID=2593535 RepID=A0A552X3J6_9GAMM|nr:YqcC family protein [Aliidiomarina halalkaliphila]TRW49565.1 YqcC family protein [Aliidiomarina halalkaliphila]